MIPLKLAKDRVLNRWIEYATPGYNWTDDDGSAANLVWLKGFADPSPATAASR